MSALAGIKDTVLIEVWEKEYIPKKNDPAFLVDYINKRFKESMITEPFFNDYLKLIPEEERTSDIVAELYKKVGTGLKAHTLAYENLLKNKEKFSSKLHDSVNSILYYTSINTIREEAKSKNEELLAVALQAYDQLHKNSISKQKDEIYIDYYLLTRETDDYLKYVVGFCNNYLVKMSADSMDKADQIHRQAFEKQLSSITYSTVDSTKMAQAIKLFIHITRDRISLRLNQFAWEVFERVSDTKTLQDALHWSTRSLELSPNSSYMLDTYANLLYKLGQKKEAVLKEEEALRFANKNEVKSFTETLRKMKAGEKTWKENMEPIGSDVIYIR